MINSAQRQDPGLRRRRRSTLTICAATAAAVFAAALAAMALASASSPTMTIAAAADAGLGEQVLVSPQGHTLYALSPETTHHLLCKSSECLKFWPPLTVASRNTRIKGGSGVEGHFGLLRRSNGMLQVTYRGMPLYRYSGDHGKDEANGQGLRSFGGSWHVLNIASAPGAPAATNTPAPPAPSGPAGGYEPAANSTSTSTPATAPAPAPKPAEEKHEEPKTKTEPGW